VKRLNKACGVVIAPGAGLCSLRDLSRKLDFRRERVIFLLALVAEFP
jgi:hypothetical protein